MTLAAAALAGLGVGYWLDSRFDTRPILLLVGGCVGAGGGMYHFIRSVMAYSRNQVRKQ